jgi:uncharacterized protein YceH (UPF0502 family)
VGVPSDRAQYTSRMNIRLTALEARVIGSLIEKQITTPDQYPMSLNALVNACNQKSNRDPVMNLTEGQVQETVNGLSRRHFIVEKSGFGSRVPKYQQIFCNTEFGSLKFTPQETAIVCELLVRGPQTPGELRSRVPRMAPLPDPNLIEALLEGLANRPEGGLVVRLAREAGRRDARYAQTFEELPASLSVSTGDDAPPPRSASEFAAAPVSAGPTLAARVAALEEEVAELRAQIAALKGAQP